MENDSTRAFLETLMPMSSASLPLVLSLSHAKFITSVRSGDTVVVDPGGPIARINVGTSLNQGPQSNPYVVLWEGLGL